jgi:hypothetical protein
MKRSKPAEIVELRAPPEQVAASARVGWIADVSHEGRARVDFPGNPAGPLQAVSIVRASRADLEAAAERRQQVVLLFDGGDLRSPILVGFVVTDAPLAEATALAEVPAAAVPEVAVVDGRRVAIEGMDEVVLVCGKASITLRRNGRIVVRGTQVETDADGVNRIKGASVRIN